ncbi:MAG: glycosyl transferase family 1 [Litorilinea sp.]|nr:MAG: glycosyl transferase family 1 [Litorilinea sp.]
MHIALITTYPPSQGSLNEYAHHFVRALRGKEEIHHLTLLVDELPHGQAYPQPENRPGLATLEIVPCWRFNDPANPWRILRQIRKVQPDLALFNLQFASFGDKKIPAMLGLITPMLVRLAGYPSMVLLHNIMETVDLRSAGYARHRVLEWLMRGAGTLATYALLQADLVALTIPKYVEIFRTKYRARNVLLAPHGSFDDQVAMPSFETPPGPRRIMAFGKFGTYKRIEMMVEALKRLEERGYRDLELVIAGTDSPNAKGYLDEMKRRYGHIPNLRFLGYVPEEEVADVFRSATVVVFPYTSTTGSSGVLHQAGSYGCAVALPNIGDFAEVITEEGYTGEFFEPNDPDSLADAIAHLLDDEELRQSMGMRNFLASRGLPIADVLDWYVLHFQELLAKRGRRHTSTTPAPVRTASAGSQVEQARG